MWKLVFGLILAVSLLAGADLCSAAEPVPTGAAPSEEPAPLAARDEEVRKDTEKFTMEVHYPVFGIPTLDAAMTRWARDIAAAFEEDAGRMELLENGQKSELDASYTVSSPSARAVSVTYTISSYMGGAAHGFVEIATRSYDLRTGEPLALTDIFGDAPAALRLLSEYARADLQRELGEDGDPEWIAKGTEPSINNFSSMALTPQGLHIHIQPYQVGPWVLGPQAVDVPLDALREARPKLEFWGVNAE